MAKLFLWVFMLVAMLALAAGSPQSKDEKKNNGRRSLPDNMEDLVTGNKFARSADYSR